MKIIALLSCFLCLCACAGSPKQVVSEPISPSKLSDGGGYSGAYGVRPFYFNASITPTNGSRPGYISRRLRDLTPAGMFYNPNEPHEPYDPDELIKGKHNSSNSD